MTPLQAYVLGVIFSVMGVALFMMILGYVVTRLVLKKKAGKP